MRLRQRDLKPYYVKQRISLKEPDGTVSEAWSQNELPNPTWLSETTADGDKSIDSGTLFNTDMPAYRFWEMYFGPSFMSVAPGEVIPGVIWGNLQPTGGKLMAEMYGERLAYMMTMYVVNDAEIAETNGLCVYVNPNVDPDYKVVAVQRWNTHKVIHLEKVIA